MKVTLQWLKKWGACSEGVDYYKAHPESDPVKLARQLTADVEAVRQDYDCDALSWANWLIARALSREGRIRYAVFAARQCAENYNKRYPDDNRINEAIAAAERVIERDTAAIRSAAESAWSAAESAWSAAESAWSAVSAARSARSAARSAWSAVSAGSAWCAVCAGSAAESAWCAAESAAESAGSAWSAVSARSAARSAWSAAQTKILNYGITLLEADHLYPLNTDAERKVIDEDKKEMGREYYRLGAGGK